MDHSEIQKQAKELLDHFAKSLEQVEKEEDIDSYVNRELFERNEKDQIKQNQEDFKKRILDNAPRSNHDFILTEKGGWKK